MSGWGHKRRNTVGQDAHEDGEDGSSPSSPAAEGKRGRQPLTPLQRALALLTRREHSRRELARKLVERGVEAAEAEAVVERLAGEGWQDDRRYAELVVRSRVSGGYGPRRIRAELSQQGLEADLISEAMDGFDGDWTETACDLVRRRFGPAGLQSLAQRRKAADLLFRRGFEGDAIQRATRLGAED